MNKRILIGSIITVFLLMILPSISATEFNIAMETNKSNLLEKIQSMDVEELETTIKDTLIGLVSLLVKILLFFIMLGSFKVLYLYIRGFLFAPPGNQPPATPDPPS